ncbi:P-selectin glycoprotein ligand 1 [Antechinus flavipes]|uniref:P-selectin glycoprotein ligand 1 n=1 Tax=Antechinus flavipes TaxID=38775 RepID=UPI002236932F|nr:P-selectin glycoprotein ligand 1 [Antechinus flavipes]
MSMTTFFFLLTLRLHGSGQPIGAEAWEAREPLADRVKRDLEDEDDDDYEPYNTPPAELMENDTLPASPPGTVGAGLPGAATDRPGSEPVGRGATAGMTPGATAGMTTGATAGMTTGATAGMTPGATAGMTPGATERGTAGSALAEEPTSGLVSTRDLSTHRAVTAAPETLAPTTEEATSPVQSSGQPGAYNSTGGAAATESAAVSRMGSAATATSAPGTDTPRTAGASGGRLLTDSASTILPAELQPNGSSPASALNASGLSTPSLPPTSPPGARVAPAAVTGWVGPSPSSAPEAATTTAQLFLSGHIPVRQCLLAVLILALVATVFLVCTVVLAIRLSKKGHTYPVRDYSPTEMVCISSLMVDGDPAANGGPAGAKSELLKPGPDSGEDGDELTLHSFLP